MTFLTQTKQADVVLIGGGIMSATLGAMLRQVEPSWSIVMCEALDELGLESSGPWNNAGTGHSALCELNYTPAAKDGSVSAEKAVSINEQFQLSRQFWAHMVSEGYIGSPEMFINSVPHMSFVMGEDHSKYLHTRYEALKPNPLFSGMDFSQDRDQISEWAPLVMAGREGTEPLAATRAAEGTDIDFGRLTKELVGYLTKNDGEINLGTAVTDLRQEKDKRWTVSVKHLASGEHGEIKAKMVFIGSGGGALHLLQRSGIREGKGYGGFPVSGKFFRCTNPDIANRHHAKVYGQAQVGAPPMSVPHLDTRYVNGERSLLFGPYGGFSTNFLKHGSWLDLPLSIRPNNILTMISAGLKNFGLVGYLISEVTKSRAGRVRALQEYFPQANGDDWELITAGQRVQIMKKTPQGSVLQFGTEVITSEDGSVSALLGASPGASTAVPIMLELLERCFPRKFKLEWQETLHTMIPTLGTSLNENPDLAAETMAKTSQTLKLDPR